MSHCWKIINLVNFLHDLSFVALSLTLILYSFILRFKVNERVLLTTKTLLEASLALWPPVAGSILFFFSLVAVKNSWSSGYFALSRGPNCRVRYHFSDAWLLIWVIFWFLSPSLRNRTSIDKKLEILTIKKYVGFNFQRRFKYCSEVGSLGQNWYLHTWYLKLRISTVQWKSVLVTRWLSLVHDCSGMVKKFWDNNVNQEFHQKSSYHKEEVPFDCRLAEANIIHLKPMHTKTL